MIKSSAGDSVKVFVRVRPFNLKESQTSSCVTFNQTTIEMNDKEPDHRFAFDQVFGMESTQQQIYQHVGANVVESAFQGFNGTIFAYGQTSSGKTHTCIGPDHNDPELQGILPRIVSQMFKKMQEAPTFIEFRIKISMVEIYMEKIKDLFDISKNDIKIRQKQGKGIYMQDVTEEYVASATETMELIKRGIAHRSVGQTNMNDTSSRSHMAFIITLYQNNLKDASAKSGKIILVDLAGSEKISKTGAQGKLLDEAKQINKSLSALGNVINALTQAKIAHIPYRDSKLTRLLQQSLGGNSRTNLIINVSPSADNEPETLSSLRFGFRAKQIKNKPKVNREYTVAELLVLLEKAQRRNQELEQMIKEITTSKKKNMEKKSSVQYVENLLDSENPLVTGAEDEEEIVQVSKLKAPRLSRREYDSDFASESQEQLQLQSSIKQLTSDTQLLKEEIQLLNIEKVELLRELDIVQEKYEIISKETKISSTKLKNVQKQNENMLMKLVNEKSKNEEYLLKMKELEEKIESYEQKIISIGAIPENKNAKIFGTSDLATKTKQMVELVKKNKLSDQSVRIQDKIEKEKQIHMEKDQKIEKLFKKCKEYEAELAVFKNLEQSKQAFIKEKMKFSEDRARLESDLENRINRVIQLEERLDEEKEKTRYYEKLIKEGESDKSRRILSLEQHLNEMSEGYYVLKGQQTSWLKDNKNIQKKIQVKNTKIGSLQKQIIQLKESVEFLKLHVQDLEESKKEQSALLDFNYTQEQEQTNTNKPKIVKVVRSSTFNLSDYSSAQ